MLIVTGRMTIKQAEMSTLLAAASTMAAQTTAESGCGAYRFGIDVDDRDVVHLFEQWDSPQSLDAHFATPHFSAFSDVLLASVIGEAEFTRYEVAAKAPLFG